VPQRLGIYAIWMDVPEKACRRHPPAARQSPLADGVFRFEHRISGCELAFRSRLRSDDFTTLPHAPISDHTACDHRDNLESRCEMHACARRMPWTIRARQRYGAIRRARPATCAVTTPANRTGNLDDAGGDDITASVAITAALQDPLPSSATQDHSRPEVARQPRRRIPPRRRRAARSPILMSRRFEQTAQRHALYHMAPITSAPRRALVSRYSHNLRPFFGLARAPP